MDQEVSRATFEAGAAQAVPYLKLRGATVVRAEYPDLIFERAHLSTGRVCRFRLRYDHFDEQPASVQVIGADGVVLPFDQWPRGSYWNPENGGTLCVPGIREYHQHSSHRGEPWELHRAAGTHTFGAYIDIVLAKFFEGGY